LGGHKEHVKAVELAVTGFEMAEHYEIAEAIHFSVGTKDVDGEIEVARAKGDFDICDHLFEPRGHRGEVGTVRDVDLGGYGFGPVTDVQKKVADAFKRDDELHAGEKLAR